MAGTAKRGALALATAVMAAAPAAADECDCARRVGLCQASAAIEGTTISFTSQTPQCSRISFTVADHPGAITIRNGAGRAAFPAPAGASVAVDACYVCDVEGAGR